MPVVFADFKFILGLTLSLAVAFAGLRLLLVLCNRELVAPISFREILKSFFIGWRFDMIIVGAIMLVPIILELFPAGARLRGLICGWVLVPGGLALLLGVIELEFYKQFHARLNSLVFDYIKEDPKTVTSMIWHGCPVLLYLALWGLLALGLAAAVLGLDHLTRPPAGVSDSWGLRLLVFLPVLAAHAIACRGTLRSGPPLRWGDAYHSRHLFANHLALNGIYTLIKALLDVGKRKDRRKWLKAQAPEKALETVREMLFQPGDEPRHEAGKPILRCHRPQPGAARSFRNVVVVIMESFSAHHLGVLGDPGEISPEFDRLAREGVLFDHFFSSGTHTHQGLFATLAAFPNLPGYETLMQQPQGATRFSGLINLLGPERFSDIFLYNGDYAWDNQEGFFRNQGMTRFIGRFDFEDPRFIDPTWGVSDQDMFDRALAELDRLDPGRPFLAVLQTLSNHLPFTIPEPLPMPRVEGHGTLDGHLTAMRYADWALGRFFAAAKELDCYADTLFVLVGDHGFCVPEQITDIELLRFHIPLLLLGEGLQERYGARRATVGSQVDVVPTILGLLGRPFTHQCWGRNLLNLEPDDPGFAVIKPSSSDTMTALIEGETLYAKPDIGTRGRLYDYRLNLAAGAELKDDPELARAMEQRLTAYLQTAMRALVNGETGL